MNSDQTHWRDFPWEPCRLDGLQDRNQVTAELWDGDAFTGWALSAVGNDERRAIARLAVDKGVTERLYASGGPIKPPIGHPR